MPDALPTILLLAAISEEIAPTLRLLGLRSPRPGINRAGHCVPGPGAQSPVQNDSKQPGEFWTSCFGSTRLIAAVSGMGSRSACQALACLNEQFKPSRVILLGFAGGLNPSLKPGHVLPVREVINESGQFLPCELPPALEPAPAYWHMPARLLTVDHLAATPAAKTSLRSRTSADLVDMETYAVARLARALGLPLTVLRAVSDPADTVLPAALLTCVKPDGRPDRLAALRYLWRHPRDLPQLLRLARHARLCSQRLAQVVQLLLKRLSD
ncbi:MAG: hypothetical protein IT443_00590 [Phycisphaeraceae bacterium]|nr:hypothetical protein [Phycisphaeraceae bacterium]